MDRTSRATIARAPRRRAATRAAESILYQYTTPFAPRVNFRGNLGNTATLYDKDEGEFYPASFVASAVSDSGPTVRPTGRQAIGVGAGPRVATAPYGREKDGRFRSGPSRPSGYLLPEQGAGLQIGHAASRKTTIRPARKVARRVESGPSSAREEAAGPSQPAVTSRKRKSSPVTPSNDLPGASAPPIPPAPKKPRWVTSPLTPRSSDIGDGQHQTGDDNIEMLAPYLPLSFPSHPLNPHVPPPFQPQSEAWDPPHFPSCGSFWGEIHPQPDSSPPLSPRYIPQVYALPGTDITAPMAEREELSRSPSTPLSSPRWSLRSVKSPSSTGLLFRPGESPDIDEATDPARPSPQVEPLDTKPSTLQTASASQQPSMAASHYSPFIPRSQAFHGFSPAPELIKPGIVIGAVKSEETVEGVLEIQASWKDLKVAFERMEQVMTKFVAGTRK